MNNGLAWDFAPFWHTRPFVCVPKLRCKPSSHVPSIVGIPLEVGFILQSIACEEQHGVVALAPAFADSLVTPNVCLESQIYLQHSQSLCFTCYFATYSKYRKTMKTARLNLFPKCTDVVVR